LRNPIQILTGLLDICRAHQAADAAFPLYCRYNGALLQARTSSHMQSFTQTTATYQLQLWVWTEKASLPPAILW